MTLRPVDLQTMIPKLPEVQKVKSAENEILKNNLSINILKDQQQNEKSTKQVIGAKKTQGKRVDREGRQKDRERSRQEKSRAGEDEKKSEQEKEKKGETLKRIDIRI